MIYWYWIIFVAVALITLIPTAIFLLKKKNEAEEIKGLPPSDKDIRK